MTHPTQADALAALDDIKLTIRHGIGDIRKGQYNTLRTFIEGRAESIPDGWKLVPAAMVDPTNHHNALACQYCTQDKIIIIDRAELEGMKKYPTAGYCQRQGWNACIDALIAKAKGE